MWLPACIGVIGYPIFYTHVAPLGLNAAQLVHAACYKHIAPLGVNAAQLAARYPSWGEVSLRPVGWGTQPLRIQLRLLTFQFSRLPVDMSPLWGFGCLVHAAFYKHAAPLGLNIVHTLPFSVSSAESV